MIYIFPWLVFFWWLANSLEQSRCLCFVEYLLIFSGPSFLVHFHPSLICGFNSTWWKPCIHDRLFSLTKQWFNPLIFVLIFSQLWSRFFSYVLHRKNFLLSSNTIAYKTMENWTDGIKRQMGTIHKPSKVFGFLAYNDIDILMFLTSWSYSLGSVYKIFGTNKLHLEVVF